MADNSQGTQRSLGSDEEDIEFWSCHLQYVDCEHQQWRPEGQSGLGSMPTKATGTEDDGRPRTAFSPDVKVIYVPMDRGSRLQSRGSQRVVHD